MARPEYFKVVSTKIKPTKEGLYPVLMEGNRIDAAHFHPGRQHNTFDNYQWWLQPASMEEAIRAAFKAGQRYGEEIVHETTGKISAWQMEAMDEDEYFIYITSGTTKTVICDDIIALKGLIQTDANLNVPDKTEGTI